MRDYSLWLLPPPREGAAWRALIRRLAADFDAPVFEPHVTLLGGIAAPPSQALAAAREWAQSSPPLLARPRAIACRNEYYRCVFVELEKTPELLAARRRAERIFKRAGGAYLPHLSLLYGCYDAATKRRAVAAVGKLSRASLRLPCAALVAMAAGGTPADWEVAEVFPLAPSAGAAREEHGAV